MKEDTLKKFKCSREEETCSSAATVEMEKLPRISLIIATHNEASVIQQKIINSLELDYPKDKMTIIIADDFSSDETRKICSRYAKEGGQIRIISNRYQRGKAGALKTAFEENHSELLAITDADVILEHDALRCALEHLREKSVGAVCGVQKLIHADGSPYFAFEDTYRKIHTRIRMFESRLDSAVILHGQCLIIKKTVLTCPVQDVYTEDVDLAIRIRKNGYRVGYAPACVFYERVPVNPDEFCAQKLRRGIGLVHNFIRHKDVLFKPRYGLYGMVIFPFEYFLHLIQPFFFFAGIVLLPLAVLAVNVYWGVLFLIFFFFWSRTTFFKVYFFLNKTMLKAIFQAINAKTTSRWEPKR